MTLLLTTWFTTFDSPIGKLTLTSNGESITGIGMDLPPHSDWQQDNEPFHDVTSQLQAYFRGELQSFDFAWKQSGTPFQRTVWEALCQIPYGETISYAELARRVGDPKACRAVGSANGKNSIAIVVPCHRVIAASGSLGGYAGGLWRKEWLLKHEKSVRALTPSRRL